MMGKRTPFTTLYITLDHYDPKEAIRQAIEEVKEGDYEGKTTRFKILPVGIEIEVNTYRDTTEYKFEFQVDFD